MSTKLHRQNQLIFSAGALLGVTGVVLGAYGAHGLRADSSSWMVAVQYQLLHAIVLLVVGLWHQLAPNKWLIRSAAMLVVGVIFFSGSIYGLVTLGLSWLGPITPLGGVSLILGWLAMLVAIWRAD